MESQEQDNIPEPGPGESENSRFARFRNARMILLLFCPALVIGAFVWASLNGWIKPVELGSKSTTVAAQQALPPPIPINDKIPEEEISAEEAVEMNAAIPESAEPIVAARPFLPPATGMPPMSRSTALNCLTSAIYYEAATESEKGQRAVAQVVLNRVRHPAYPSTVCGVVFQGSERSTGCQFTFTCDGSLSRTPNKSIWKRAERIATAAYAGAVEPAVGSSTHYHTVWILPYWAKSLTKVKTIGSHIFYRWPGSWGKRSAFTDTYAGEDLSGDLGEASELAGEIEDGLVSATGAGEDETTEIPPLIPDLRKSPIPDNAEMAADRTIPVLEADRNKGTLIID